MGKQIRNTRENVVELLQKMAENCHDLAKYNKERNPEWSSRLLSEAIAYGTAADLLTDPEYFVKNWEAFNR